jgi:hypothetical protein
MFSTNSFLHNNLRLYSYLAIIDRAYSRELLLRMSAFRHLYIDSMERYCTWDRAQKNDPLITFKHIAYFFVLSIIYGMILLQNPIFSPRDILPPYMSFVALAFLTIHELKKFQAQRLPLADVKYEDDALELNNRSPLAHDLDGVNTRHESTTVDPNDGLVRRNSNLSRSHTTNLP